MHMAFSIERFFTDISSNNFVSFSYTDSQRAFNIGDKTVPVSEPWIADVAKAQSQANKVELDVLRTSPIVMGGGFGLELFALEAFKNGLDLLSESERNQLELSTRLAMLHAYGEYEMSRSSGLELTTESFTRNPFLVSLSDPSGPRMPTFWLSPDTSLHVMAEGRVGERGWVDDVYEYGTNNAEDMPSWEVALYAGLGHVAHTISRSS